MSFLTQEDVATALRRSGMRVTAPRLAIYRAVAELNGHPDVNRICARAADSLGSVSTQAVYDGLSSLVAAGVLRRIEPAGSPARFESRVADNHHHVVCRICGATADVDCVRGIAPCLDPARTAGFEIDEAEITFWGVCPDCQAPPTEVQSTTSEGAFNA